MGGQIASRAFYSKFLEFGTVKMLPRPFMFPALEKHRAKIIQRINKAIIISHNPKSTKIITLKGSETINNDYFTEKKIDKITGLGDNFFLLIATYLESTTSKKIKDAIKYAHQELYFLISNS